MNADSLLLELKRTPGAPGQRLYHELAYARRVSLLADGRYDSLIADAARRALDAQHAAGCLTLPLVRDIEAALSPMQAACKQYTWLLVGHAHIDMNWLWGYDETVAVTLDTFRTMLTLMEEYPRFTFAQSQASTYRMVEQYDPGMLPEIRARIREGRWEVTASSWVETDRNMPSRASEIHHLLYTKQYLSSLLELPAQRLNLDYEPDTFGHNANVPALLSRAGVQYLYHCRGERDHSLYRWRSADGSEVLVLSDPAWYNLTIGGELALRVPDFCRAHHVPAMLTVYGVGDHGGGPTRRDLNRIEDMMTWPLFPTVRFGTYHEFFALCEASREHLPVLTWERNCVFTGCYTSQSRIKRANAMAERMLGAAEMFSAFAHARTGGAYPADSLKAAWRKVLFNQFHDILPGSGVRETREYAMGRYQEAFAAATAARRSAYASICRAIDTSRFSPAAGPEDTAMGAGIGFNMGDGLTPPYCRLDGSTRIYHLFNPSSFPREELAEITVWDYTDDAALMQFVDGDGAVLPHQITGDGHAMDWFHHFTRVLVPVKAPACGYATVVLRKNEAVQPAPIPRQDPHSRFHAAQAMRLENDRVAVDFDASTGRIVRFVDRATGVEKLVDGGFDFIREDPSEGMTAWIVGRYSSVAPVKAPARVRQTMCGPLRQAWEVTTSFGEDSTLRYTVSLDQGDDKLIYTLDCDWHELGGPDAIPQLSFSARLPQAREHFLYRVPGGVLERCGDAQDKPSLGAIQAGDVALMCDSRYGFRGDGCQLRVALIRGSFDPDPIPEIGHVGCRVAVGLSGDIDEAAEAFARRMDVVSNTCHPGTLPLGHTFLALEGDRLALDGIKLSEDRQDLVIHLHNPGQRPAHARLVLDAEPAAAILANYLEEPMGDCMVTGRAVALSLPAAAAATLRITLSRKGE